MARVELLVFAFDRLYTRELNFGTSYGGIFCFCGIILRHVPCMDTETSKGQSMACAHQVCGILRYQLSLVLGVTDYGQLFVSGGRYLYFSPNDATLFSMCACSPQ